MQNSDILSIKEQFQELIARVVDLDALNRLKVEFLGKKAKITTLTGTIKSYVDEEERKEFGAMVHEIRMFITGLIESKREELENQRLKRKLDVDKIDVTLPGHDLCVDFGKKHILTHTIEQVRSIMAVLGFKECDGPEIESEWYNFTALNVPKNHPARQMHDTFYVDLKSSDTCDDRFGKMLLRTHTSTVQIRHMENNKPPMRIFNCGRVYRADYDATHTPMFHQLEGLWIDSDVTIANMVDIMKKFLKLFFEIDDVTMQFRSSYFPFTEPSFEVDIKCDKSRMQKDCLIEIGKGDDWLEIVGCGMVHPNVLTNVGICADKYQGFAFGFGIDRLAMLKYNIGDLRPFFENDKRWIDHHGVIFGR